MEKKHTLIIVPGWGGTADSWSDCVAQLKKIVPNTHVVELPCFGKEPCPKTVWGVKEYADFLTKRIKDLRSGHTIIMAHSFGGAVTTRALAQDKTLVDSYIMIGAAIVRPTRRIKRVVSQWVARAGKLVLSLPVLNKYKEPAQKKLYKLLGAKDYLDTAGMQRDIYKKIIREDQQAYLKELTVPVRVIWGKWDKLTPLRHGKKVFRQLPSATLRIVNGRHGLHHTHIHVLCQVVKEAVGQQDS